MKRVDVNALTPEIFKIFSENNALLTAGDKADCNTMTIGWANFGTLWELPTCTVYVRPERYTYEFLERHEYFTVSVLRAEDRKTAQICGTKSGRDCDKIAECGLTLAYGEGDAPYFEESELVVVCRKLFYQDIDVSKVTDPRVTMFYTGSMGSDHRVYIGEVVEAYIK